MASEGCVGSRVENVKDGRKLGKAGGREKKSMVRVKSRCGIEEGRKKYNKKKKK